MKSFSSFQERSRLLIAALESKPLYELLMNGAAVIYLRRDLAPRLITLGSPSITWFAEAEIPVLKRNLAVSGLQLVEDGEVFAILCISSILKRGKHSPPASLGNAGGSDN